MENHEKRPLPEARTYTVEDIAAMLNIGRTSAYTLVKEGHFKTVRIGTAIRISGSVKDFSHFGLQPLA